MTGGVPGLGVHRMFMLFRHAPVHIRSVASGGRRVAWDRRILGGERSPRPSARRPRGSIRAEGRLRSDAGQPQGGQDEQHREEAGRDDTGRPPLSRTAEDDHDDAGRSPLAGSAEERRDDAGRPPLAHAAQVVTGSGRGGGGGELPRPRSRGKKRDDDSRDRSGGPARRRLSLRCLRGGARPVRPGPRRQAEVRSTLSTVHSPPEAPSSPDTSTAVTSTVSEPPAATPGMLPTPLPTFAPAASVNSTENE